MIRGYSHRKTAKRGWIACLLTLTVLGGALLLFGCGDSALQSTEASLDEESTYFFDQPFYADELAKRVTIDTTYEVVQLLTALEGGVIMLDGTQDLATAEALVVQELSIPTDTIFQIEITKIITDDGSPIIYDCHPDGLVFSQPAILRINAWADFGKKTEEVYLYRLNETTHMWELQMIAPVGADGMTYFPIPHFSRWGADDPPRGPISGGSGG